MHGRNRPRCTSTTGFPPTIMFEQTSDMQSKSPSAERDEAPAERTPFVRPAVTDLGRMSDLTLLGGSL
jgi:hypothetical protein